MDNMNVGQVYEIVRKLQLDYNVTNSPYIVNPTQRTYSALKDKQNKVINVPCLYFVYQTKLLKCKDIPMSFNDVAKYANYFMCEWRMDFYFR